MNISSTIRLLVDPERVVVIVLDCFGAVCHPIMCPLDRRPLKASGQSIIAIYHSLFIIERSACSSLSTANRIENEHHIIAR